MSAVREFFGTKCLACAKDILQPPPQTNRMPIPDRAYCPRCGTVFTLKDLETAHAKGTGIFARLFGRSTPSG
ncbi:MAG: hypothetical protein ACYDCK_14305 [Thermoplasmatota archaeon]